MDRRGESTTPTRSVSNTAITRSQVKPWAACTVDE